DLRAADGADEGGRDGGAGKNRAADLEAVVVGDHQDLVEPDRAPGLSRLGEELHVEDVAGRDAILLATTLNHCVHERCSESRQQRRVDGETYHRSPPRSNPRLPASWLARLLLEYPRIML